MHKNVVKILDKKDEKSENNASSGPEKGGKKTEGRGTNQPLENAEVHSEKKDDSLLDAEYTKGNRNENNITTIVKESEKVSIIKPKNTNKEGVWKESFPGNARKSEEKDTNKEEAKPDLSPEMEDDMEVNENDGISEESSSENDGQEEEKGK